MSKSKAPTTVKSPGVDCQAIKNKIQSGSLVDAANEGLATANEGPLGDMREYGGTDRSAQVKAIGDAGHKRALSMGLGTTASAVPKKKGRFGFGGKSHKKRRGNRAKREESRAKREESHVEREIKVVAAEDVVNLAILYDF